MSRPKIIQELSHHLATVLESALQSTVAGDPRVQVHWVHPQDVDRVEANQLPFVGLYLMEVVPETRWRAAGASLEGGGEKLAPDGLPSQWRRLPLWIICRYVLSFRGRHPTEEQELIAQAIQAIQDHPLVPSGFLPSIQGVALKGMAPQGAALQGMAPLTGEVQAYPITWRAEGEVWRRLGLSRHRLLLSCEITVPLPSSRREPAQRVLERQLLLESKEAFEFLDDEVSS